ncbi:hypothetical protein [Ruegeria arenilitoris]|uniref:hypothetical protein n=1 Tax=Ruegeria arenilitoris TaxID=1173585 RepID=UPI0014806776|nr:hypothetical protein [Ruegeria arenilitoris]
MFIFALLMGVAAFIGFMSLVGSPSEVETIIGLIFAAVVFLFSLIVGWRLKYKFREEDQNNKIAELEREVAELRRRK